MSVTRHFAAIAAAFLASTAIAASAQAQETQQPAQRYQQAAVQDTACAPAAAAASDTARRQLASADQALPAAGPCRNQSQSGVTSSSGASTLGPGVGQATADQGQPVKAKGDTLRKAADSARAPR